MKKLISILLCVIMLMMIPVQALAAQGDVIITNEGQIKDGIQSWCGVGDTLYIAPYTSSNENGKTFFVHRAGEAAPTEYTVKLGEPLTERNSYEDVNILSCGGKVYVLRTITFYGEASYSVQAELYEITIEGDQAVGTLIGEPDWSIFASDGGYYNSPQDIIGTGDYLIGKYYDDMGDIRIVRMSLNDLKFSLCEFEGDLVSITPYMDGKALIQYFGDGGETVQFMVYDPASDTSEMLIEVKVNLYDNYSALACNFETGTVYYTSAGEVFELNLQTGESSEALTDMPISPNYGMNAVVLDGGYYAVGSYNGYAIRNLYPAQKPTRSLKIYDSSYEDFVTKAFYNYVNAHGDVATIISREYNEVDNLVENMMNRSDDVDVYIIRSESSDSEAVFNRGYMAELTDSEKIKAAAERMYPEVREAYSINGELCALPINFDFNQPLLQNDAMEKIGLTMENIPTNWSDFLDFLIEDLPAMLPEDGSISLTDPWTSDVWARESMFYMIFDAYQQMLKKDPNGVSTNQMVELLQKLEKVDFVALGQPSQEMMDSDDYSSESHEYLMELNTYCTLQAVTYYKPLVLALTPDTPALFSMSSTVAFINPFSKNKDLALELIEELLDSLPYGVTYGLFTDMTAPIENDSYEEGLKNLQNELEKQKAEYETAETVDKQAIQEYITSLEETISTYSRYQYDVSPEAIEWIHEHMPMFAVQGENWLYSDDSGEAYELVNQYIEGQLDARKLMDAIGKKIQMMLMEGY